MTEERKHLQDIIYLKEAKVHSELSYCEKKKVAAFLVKNNRTIANGINGRVSGAPNVCEGADGKTLWETIHAESNAIISVAASTQSTEGATMYITCAPCKDCSKLIVQAKVVRVVYAENYKDLDGVDFLRKHGVVVEKIEI